MNVAEPFFWNPEMSDSDATVNHVQQNTVAAGVAVVEVTGVHDADVIVDSRTLKESVAVAAVVLALKSGLAVDIDGMWMMDQLGAYSIDCCPFQDQSEEHCLNRIISTNNIMIIKSRF